MGFVFFIIIKKKMLTLIIEVCNLLFVAISFFVLGKKWNALNSFD